MAAYGPTRKWLSVSTASAFWGTPASLCSPRAFPSVAHSGHGAIARLSEIMQYPRLITPA
jgi:hypothetical protein